MLRRSRGSRTGARPHSATPLPHQGEGGHGRGIARRSRKQLRGLDSRAQVHADGPQVDRGLGGQVPPPLLRTTVRLSSSAFWKRKLGAGPKLPPWGFFVARFVGNFVQKRPCSADTSRHVMYELEFSRQVVRGVRFFGWSRSARLLLWMQPLFRHDRSAELPVGSFAWTLSRAMPHFRHWSQRSPQTRHSG